MNAFKEIKCLVLMMKAAKCMYFLKKIVVVLFFATLACTGIKCMCSKGCDMKKQIKKMF